MNAEPIGFIARIDAYDSTNTQVNFERFVIPNDLYLESHFYSLFHYLFTKNHNINLCISDFTLVFPEEEIRPIFKKLIKNRSNESLSLNLNPNVILKALGYNKSDINKLINNLNGENFDVSDSLLSSIRKVHHKTLFKLTKKSICIKHPEESICYDTTIDSVNVALSSHNLPKMSIDLTYSKRNIDKTLKRNLKLLSAAMGEHIDEDRHIVEELNELFGLNCRQIVSSFDVLSTGIRYKNCLRNRWKSNSTSHIFEDIDNEVLFETDTNGIGHTNGKCNSEVSDKTIYDKYKVAFIKRKYSEITSSVAITSELFLYQSQNIYTENTLINLDDTHDTYLTQLNLYRSCKTRHSYDIASRNLLQKAINTPLSLPILNIPNVNLSFDITPIY